MAVHLLLSSKVTDEKKKSIVEAMVLSEDDFQKKIKCPMAEYNELGKKQLHDLVTLSSRFVLQ